MPILENEHLLVELDFGTFTRIINKRHDLNLVETPNHSIPWQIETPDQTWHTDIRDIDEDEPDDHLLSCMWRGSGFDVAMWVQLNPGERAARITMRIGSNRDRAIDKVELPIIRGIGDFGYGDRTRLAHAQGTGFLFHNPLNVFTDAKPGLRYSPYPEGFSGSSMQLMAYYVEGLGGFSFSANDASGGMKWLNFWKEDDALSASFMHQAPDVKNDNVLAPAYDMLIGAMDEGTWHEAAETYKSWAVNQAWTSKGKLSEHPNWLHTDTGFATFGINASHDRSLWLDHFHQITGKPVFHVLGVNWPHVGGNYGRVHPGGRDDWFPAHFDPENLATIDRNGDFWAPFEFDLLQNPGGAEREQIAASLVEFQDEKYSFDAYTFPFHCPVTPYQRELHAWRDAKLTGEYGADALYYDISANNVTMQCRSAGHGHPVGGGSWMVDAYRSMWAETGKAASAAKGAHVPQGAEMVNEVFLDRLDFFQARAEATPLSPFESGFFRDWIIEGRCEKIPLFAFVYHEYGPVRLDGWGKLSVETGELWYWVAARVALWGGMYELNYEFSPLEVLEGHMEDVLEHYAAIAPVEYAIDPAKEQFVREIALARTGFARQFLVFGTMRRPLPLDVPEIALNWRMYNFNPKSDIYDQQGTQQVPVVQHSAWVAPDGSLGLLFVNLDATASRVLPLAFSLIDYGIDWSAADIDIVTNDGAEGITGSVDANNIAIDLTLPPRKVVLVRISNGKGPQ